MQRRFALKPWHFIALSLVAGLGFWLLDSVYAFFFFRQHLRYMLFDPPASFRDAVLANATSYSLLIRLSFLNLCLIGGCLAAAYANQRQKAEQNLRAERDYSAGIIEGSPIIIFGATLEGQITFLNRAAELTLGYVANEAIGLPWWQIFHSNHNETAARTQFLTLAQGQVRDYQTPVWTQDGQQRTIAWSAIRQPGHQGIDEQIIGFGRDITDSKRSERRLRRRLAAEEALAEASRRFVSSAELDMSEVLRLLLNPMNVDQVYVFRVDSDGIIHLIAEAADSNAQRDSRRLPELRSDQLPPLMLRLVAKEDVMVADVSQLPDILKTERALMESYGVRALAIVPIQSTDGDFLGFLGMNDTRQPRKWRPEDLSSLHVVAGMIAAYWGRRAAEEQLLEERSRLAERVTERTEALQAVNIELARASRLKDEFLAAMSHELRTPLNAILGLSEALQENVYGPLSEKQQQSLATIERSGQHLLELINDVLDVARIGAGKMEMEMGMVRVPNVCEACLRLVRRDATQKELTVSTELDDTVDQMCADERRLKQMLLNLLSNAIKFTPEGGSMGLIVKGDQSRQQVHFTVWDTGIGIASADMPHLFEPFLQLDSSLSRQYQGSGLGLTLVHQMAQLHGGSVSVESQPGEGSRFTVSLPWSHRTPH